MVSAHRLERIQQRAAHDICAELLSVVQHLRLRVAERQVVRHVVRANRSEHAAVHAVALLRHVTLSVDERPLTRVDGDTFLLQGFVDHPLQQPLKVDLARPAHAVVVVDLLWQ